MNVNSGAMKNLVISLLEKNRNNAYLKNKIELQCKCGYSCKFTYYDVLTSGDFDIGQQTSIISPFISESIYDETINVSPIMLSRTCPDCGEDIMCVFPVSLENLISILQVQPPDPHMYG